MSSGWDCKIAIEGYPFEKMSQEFLEFYRKSKYYNKENSSTKNLILTEMNIKGIQILSVLVNDYDHDVDVMEAFIKSLRYKGRAVYVSTDVKDKINLYEAGKLIFSMENRIDVKKKGSELKKYGNLNLASPRYPRHLTAS